MRIPQLPEDRWQGSCAFHGSCWEGLAAGSALAARYGVPAAELEDDEAWQLEARYLALGVNNLVCLYRPQRIVIGGGVLRHPGLLEALRSEASRLLSASYFPEAAELGEVLTPPGSRTGFRLDGGPAAREGTDRRTCSDGHDLRRDSSVGEASSRRSSRETPGREWAQPFSDLSSGQRLRHADGRWDGVRPERSRPHVSWFPAGTRGPTAARQATVQVVPDRSSAARSPGPLRARRPLRSGPGAAPRSRGAVDRPEHPDRRRLDRGPRASRESMKGQAGFSRVSSWTRRASSPTSATSTISSVPSGGP